jgi:hypothetical protein
MPTWNAVGSSEELRELVDHLGELPAWGVQRLALVELAGDPGALCGSAQ